MLYVDSRGDQSRLLFAGSVQDDEKQYFGKCSIHLQHAQDARVPYKPLYSHLSNKEIKCDVAIVVLIAILFILLNFQTNVAWNWNPDTLLSINAYKSITKDYIMENTCATFLRNLNDGTV